MTRRTMTGSVGTAGRLRFRFDRTTELTDDVAAVVDRFCGTPARWLPLAAGIHGISVFDGRLRGLVVPVAARFVIGAPWENGGVTTRSVRVDVGGSPSGGRPDVPPLVHLDGELSVSRVSGRTRLRFRGTGGPRGHGARRLLGRLLLPVLARRVLRATAAGLGRHA